MNDDSPEDLKFNNDGSLRFNSNGRRLWKKNIPSPRAQIINCDVCGKKNHYRYTREELIDFFYSPDGPKIKPCITDFNKAIIWINHKLEDESEPE